MERKRGIRSALLVIAVLATAQAAHAQGLDPRSGVDQGLLLFSQGRYAEALPLFRQAAGADERYTPRSDAQYWTIMSRIALGETVSVLPDIETFRTSYRDSRHLPDLLYQRGRIQFVAGDLMAAYETFKWFVNEPLWTHPLRPSAIYWMGECLYAMDKPELARTVFQAIVRDYPTSVKYEAARYRLESLAQKDRERALLDELERARISASAGKVEYNRKIGDLEATIAGLRTQVSDLNARLAALQGKPAASGVGAENAAGQEKLAALLAAKAETLDLLEKYIRRMNSEGGK